MIDVRAVERDHVLSAIEQYDAIGGDAVLHARGLEPSDDHRLLQGRRSYDSLAILGMAHGLATGYTPAPSEIRGGAAAAAVVLRTLGFEVTPGPEPEPTPPRAPRARATKPARADAPDESTPSPAPPRARKAAAAKPVRVEAAPAVCPRCFTQLPATGVCGYCG